MTQFIALESDHIVVRIMDRAIAARDALDKELGIFTALVAKAKAAKAASSPYWDDAVFAVDRGAVVLKAASREYAQVARDLCRAADAAKRELR
jgi:hypothetical protein